MAAIRLKDLPPPPPERTGWPWTEESPLVPARMADGREWPRISVVTPSYNQGLFLEETIRSVLLQGYSELEYIVMDGGSTDDSADIIRKYEAFLAYWVSEPDGGVEQAINAGWARSTGEFVALLPSDDWYEPAALAKSVEVLVHNSNASFFYGGFRIIDDSGKVLMNEVPKGPFEMEELLRRYYLGAPTVLIRKSFLAISGDLDSSLRFISDWDLWLRLALCSPPVNGSHWVANERCWHGSRTNNGEINRNTAYIPFERAFVLKKLLESKKFPAGLVRRVHEMIACHYVDWAHYLERVGPWRLLPQAYARAAFWDPALGIRALLRDLRDHARRGIHLALRNSKGSSA